MADLLDEVKRTYRNARSCPREGSGRGVGMNGLVHNLWIEAVANARKVGLDWQGAMAEVRAEQKNPDSVNTDID